MGEGDDWTRRDVRERVGFSAARVGRERRWGDATGVVERGVLDEESPSITRRALSADEYNLEEPRPQ